MSVGLYSVSTGIIHNRGLGLNLRQACACLRRLRFYPLYDLHLFYKLQQPDTALGNQLAPSLRQLAPADSRASLAPKLAPSLRKLAPAEAGSCCQD